ncbi:MAG: glycosyltransferase family 4 protein [Acidobacteria bacterium]|nr:glycosyltransferase family 4 protein [Acidobacteriota bacterium]
MHVSVDASPLLLRSAGVKNYLYHWIQALQRSAGLNSVDGYPFIGSIGDLTHEGSVMSLLHTAPRIAWLLASNRFTTTRRIAAGKANVFHVTNQVHGGLPGMALTATVHDMTCWLMPEFHTPANIKADQRFAERILSRADGLISVSENTRQDAIRLLNIKADQRFAERILSRADGLISVSENTRQDAIRLLNIKPEKIVTIHSGVPPSFFDVTAADAQRVRARLNLKKPFILHVGTVEPRKNLDALLDAFLLLPESVRADVELVFAGPMGWAASTTSKRILSGLPGVRYLGYVPEKDLPGLTKAATVFAQPSLYEGFGFPVAQAMAAGVPLLTSNNSCLPEISGESAVHVDPRSPAAICEGLDKLLTSESLRAEKSAIGLAKAQEYRWDRCAESSWRFFEQFA